MSSTAPSHDPATLLARLLDTIESSIIPLTSAGVASGSKVFGAAILARSDLSALTVATNDERTSPLLHGEIACIQKFFTQSFPSAASRPSPRADCVFLATHEPCSLCLSGVAWAGFGEVYHLFTHDDSRDLFAIPHDIDILDAVFRVKDDGAEDGSTAGGAGGPTAAGNGAQSRRPLYNRSNRFFTARSFAELASQIRDEGERERWMGEIHRVKGLYTALAETYQEGKRAGVETGSIWK